MIYDFSHTAIHILLHSIQDTLTLLPYLFMTYLILEYLEHKTTKKTQKLIQSSGRFGPAIGAFVSVLPQCGIAAAASHFYATRVITLGTLIAVYLATSDEMLPILISNGMPAGQIGAILSLKVGMGMLAGLCIDFIVRHKETHKESLKIHAFCTHSECHCEKGIFKSAFKHTLQIFIFILAVTLVLNTIIAVIGIETLSALVLNKPLWGPLIAGIVGLIPNCASSVVITQLYVENALTFGAFMSGLFANAGVGLLVLFKINKPMRQNFKILALLYGISVIAGIALDFI